MDFAKRAASSLLAGSWSGRQAFCPAAGCRPATASGCSSVRCASSPLWEADLRPAHRGRRPVETNPGECLRASLPAASPAPTGRGGLSADAARSSSRLPGLTDVTVSDCRPGRTPDSDSSDRYVRFVTLRSRRPSDVSPPALFASLHLTFALRSIGDREGMTLVWTRTPVAYRELDRDPGSQTLLRCEGASKWHGWMRFVPATTRAVIPRAAPLPAPADAGPRATGSPPAPAQFHCPPLHLPARFT